VGGEEKGFPALIRRSEMWSQSTEDEIRTELILVRSSAWMRFSPHDPTHYRNTSMQVGGS